MSTITNINYSKSNTVKLIWLLILQRGITVTTRKMYITISRKNFKQNISEQEFQTKYVIKNILNASLDALGLIVLLFYWNSQIFAFN